MNPWELNITLLIARIRRLPIKTQRPTAVFARCGNACESEYGFLQFMFSFRTSTVRYPHRKCVLSDEVCKELRVQPNFARVDESSIENS